MKGVSSRGNHICFGRYTLQALEPAWITARQIEVVRPAKTRMRKGSPESRVYVIKQGRILHEMGGVPKTVARATMEIATCKVPIRTQFIIAK
ncbi:hypothetical protein AMTRI_Chr13g119060 [Amborella trichopoda]